MKVGGDTGGDAAPDTRWMTYRELADFLGVEEESARRRAQRGRWPRRPGNDGKARVGVPADVTPDDTRAVTRNGAGDDAGDIPPTLAADLAELHERVGRAEGDAAAARAELARLQAAHAAELGQLAATHAAELARLLADRDHERAERRAERLAAEAERAKLTELLADAAAPWWRRLLGRRP